MARITKSLLKKVVGEEYLHRDHRSKKGRHGNIKKISAMRIYKTKKEQLKYEENSNFNR